MTDTELINYLQDTDASLISDDMGRWAVTQCGMQNVSDDPPVDIQTTFFIEKHEWRKTIREAIEAYKAEYDSANAEVSHDLAKRRNWVHEPVRIFSMKWTKANTPPPEEYHSTAMNRIPILIAFEPRGPEDRRQDEWPVVGCYIGGIVQEWRRDGSPSAWEPTHWMPMPCNPNVSMSDREAAPNKDTTVEVAWDAWQEAITDMEREKSMAYEIEAKTRIALGWLVRACEQRIPWSQREKLDEEIQDAKRILSNDQSHQSRPK